MVKKSKRKFTKKQSEEMYVAFIAGFMILMLFTYYVMDKATDSVSEKIREIIQSVEPVSTAVEKIIQTGYKPARLLTDVLRTAVGYVPGGEDTFYTLSAAFGSFIVGTIGFLIVAPFMGIPVTTPVILAAIILSALALVMPGG